MIPRLAFVVACLLALGAIWHTANGLERRGWSDNVVLLVAAALLTVLAYVILTIGPTLS